MRYVGAPAKKRRPVTQSPGGFLPCESAHYRISAANWRSVCPPQCIGRVPQPDAVGPESLCLVRHTGHGGCETYTPASDMRREARPTPSIAAGLVSKTLCSRCCPGGVRIALSTSHNSFGSARRRTGANQRGHRTSRTCDSAGARAVDADLAIYCVQRPASGRAGCCTRRICLTARHRRRPPRIACAI
jgi:hypothetical protein